MNSPCKRNAELTQWALYTSYYFEFPTHLSVCALQKTNIENSKQIFPEKELHGHCPNFHIHVSVSDLYEYIATIDLPILLQENTVCGPILGIYKSLTDT